MTITTAVGIATTDIAVTTTMPTVDVRAMNGPSTATTHAHPVAVMETGMVGVAPGAD